MLTDVYESEDDREDVRVNPHLVLGALLLAIFALVLPTSTWEGFDSKTLITLVPSAIACYVAYKMMQIASRNLSSSFRAEIHKKQLEAVTKISAAIWEAAHAIASSEHLSKSKQVARAALFEYASILPKCYVESVLPILQTLDDIDIQLRMGVKMNGLLVSELIDKIYSQANAMIESGRAVVGFDAIHNDTIRILGSLPPVVKPTISPTLAPK